MNAYIYRQPRNLFPYTVMSGEAWPWGKVEHVYMTMRGARRAVKRLGRKVKVDDRPVLVESFT